MFSIKIKSDIPIEYVEIESISVRGHLGMLTVWVSKGHWSELVPVLNNNEDDEVSGGGVGGLERGEFSKKLVPKFASRSNWKCIYRKHHRPSPRKFVRLGFNDNIRAMDGDEISFYVHSELANDMAIVYDNQHAMSGISHEDKYLVVKTGQAHLCNEPFAQWHPWGSWRKRREFVGRIEYGCRFLLWNPAVHHQFEASFRDLVMILILAKPRPNCPISWVSDDVIFYILNMCKHDWIPPKKPISTREHLSNQAVTASRRFSGILHRSLEFSRSFVNALTI